MLRCHRPVAALQWCLDPSSDTNLICVVDNWTLGAFSVTYIILRYVDRGKLVVCMFLYLLICLIKKCVRDHLYHFREPMLFMGICNFDFFCVSVLLSTSLLFFSNTKNKDYLQIYSSKRSLLICYTVCLVL